MVKHQLGHSIVGDKNRILLPCQYPEASISPMALSTMELWIYILRPIMGWSQIYDLLWETCHLALRQMWIHPSHKCWVYFPEERDRAVHSCLHSFLDRHSWEDEVYMQLREKDAKTSNRLLDVRGHLAPEAEVVYIYLSISVSVSCLPFFSSGGCCSFTSPAHEDPGGSVNSNRWPSRNKLASPTFIPKLSPFLTSPEKKHTLLHWFFAKKSTFPKKAWHMPVKLIKQTKKITASRQYNERHAAVD